MQALVQYRPCDGSCCHAVPRFPVAGNPRECRYHDHSLQPYAGGYALQSRGGCLLMAFPERQAELVGLRVQGPEKYETVPAWFRRTCVDFPQNLTPAGDPGDCCWRWEEVNGN